jgi:hypothetical protein
MATKKKAGRPTSFNKDIVDIVCKRLAAGETLRGICRDENMPHEATFRTWLLDDKNGVYTQYATARDIGLDVMADQLLDIADDSSNDTFQTEDGTERTNQEVIARSRLRVDTRKWYLSKLAPKRYGDKQSVELSGNLTLSSMSDEDILAELAALKLTVKDE